MFRPFSEPAATLELPPVPDSLPFDEMLAHDWELGVAYPALEPSKVKIAPSHSRLTTHLTHPRKKTLSVTASSNPSTIGQ